MFKEGKIQFKKEPLEKASSLSKRKWNVLIVDDEQAIHDVTELALSGFEFENRRCNFIHAQSAEQAKEIIASTPNIALSLIDVVMETDHAGLELVNYIRNNLKNKLMRIILRTGQPGQAPEQKVIHDYDINDYKSKSELTTEKLYTSVLTSLRTYRDMISLEKNRQGLKNIILSTSRIEKMISLEIFLTAVLEQLNVLLHLGDYDDDEEVASFMAAIDHGNCIQIAGTGEFKNLTSENLFSDSKQFIKPLVTEAIASGEELYRDGNYILYRPSTLEYSGFVLYLKAEKILDEMDKDLIRLFLDNAKIAYENMSLTKELDDSQREIIFTISEIAEQRSNETGQHVKRVALYSKLLGEAYGLAKEDIDVIYAAAPMHDIGKIAIPDAILKKPGKLSDDEMAIMKDHASIGYDVLKSSKRKILQISAIIANEHHEKWDGTGYPNGKKGEDIHLYARIVALCDVFDALGSRRVYKQQWGIEEILNLIKEEKGKQFDPKIVDLFLENMEKVLAIRDQYKDN
ncbi:MAG: response regulator RpfG family c-di-GMP phosphodiesterase [Sulfurimonas sp.]|jgi:response regulator RpfG family c-di-GMP phosphodiesterase|uniref:DUF3369 domain-containing protein n=1 Tax=Sulfurimonas sp. TaxID=2022749 RepID=UPI0039E5AF0E